MQCSILFLGIEMSRHPEDTSEWNGKGKSKKERQAGSDSAHTSKGRAIGFRMKVGKGSFEVSKESIVYVGPILISDYWILVFLD